MNRVRYLPAASLLLVVLFGCRQEEGLDPEQAAQARRTIVAWLECEECEAGELEAVIELGDLAVPTLAATLEQGPSPASRETLRLHLADTYRELREYAAAHPESRIEMSEDQYIQMYLDNYVALYQVRSATALAAIGGSEADRALQEALRRPLRGDVLSAISDALQGRGEQ